jgi:carbon storage regulator
MLLLPVIGKTHHFNARRIVMLVLSRKLGEKVIIGGNITVTVVEIKGNKVRLAFEAPGDVCIMREELIRNHEDADLLAKPKEWMSEEVAPCCVV